MNITETLEKISTAEKALARVIPLRDDPKWTLHTGTGSYVSPNIGTPLRTMDAAYKQGYSDAIQDLASRLFELALSGEHEAMVLAMHELSKGQETSKLWT